MSRYTQEDIDLREFLFVFWKQKTTFLFISLIGFIIGLVVTWTSPNEFTAKASLISENTVSNNNSTLSLLQQFGLSGMPIQNQDESIGVDLYPEVVTSLPFQYELITEKILIAGQETTLLSFFETQEQGSVIVYAFRWIIHLPNRLLHALTELFSNPESGAYKGAEFTPYEPDLSTAHHNFQPVQVSPVMAAVMEQMKSRITVTTKGKIIEVSVKMPTAETAALATTLTVETLTEYITRYRIRKVMSDLEFARSQMQEAKDRYETSWIELSEFRESNQGSLSARARKGEQFLEAEYQLALTIYQSFSQQYEQAKLKVQEETPVFSVLQPIQTPQSPSHPRSNIILLISIVLPIGLYSLYLILKELFHYQNMNEVTIKK